MEHITLEKLWGILVEVRTNLANHLKHHEKTDKWMVVLVGVLLTFIGGLIIKLFI